MLPRPLTGWKGVCKFHWCTGWSRLASHCDLCESLVTMYSIVQQLVVFFTVLGKRRKTGEDNIQEWFLVQKLCTVNA